MKNQKRTWPTAWTPLAPIHHLRGGTEDEKDKGSEPGPAGGGGPTEIPDPYQ